MNRILCPECGNAQLDAITVPNKQVRFEGVTLQVPNAEVLRCPACGDESYSAAELRRWQHLKQERLAQRPQIPSATDVSNLRERLGLSVSDFASLLDVTRQTVYTWENDCKTPSKLGPASLIIKLLATSDECDSDVFRQLVRFAHERGQLAKVELPNARDEYMTNDRISALRTCPSSGMFFSTC